jgi:hypothetical protein
VIDSKASLPRLLRKGENQQSLGFDKHISKD